RIDRHQQGIVWRAEIEGQAVDETPAAIAAFGFKDLVAVQSTKPYVRELCPEIDVAFKILVEVLPYLLVTDGRSTAPGNAPNGQTGWALPVPVRHDVTHANGQQTRRRFK